MGWIVLWILSTHLSISCKYCALAISSTNQICLHRVVASQIDSKTKKRLYFRIVSNYWLDHSTVNIVHASWLDIKIRQTPNIVSRIVCLIQIHHKINNNTKIQQCWSKIQSQSMCSCASQWFCSATTIERRPHNAVAFQKALAPNAPFHRATFGCAYPKIRVVISLAKRIQVWHFSIWWWFADSFDHHFLTRLVAFVVFLERNSNSMRSRDRPRQTFTGFYIAVEQKKNVTSEFPEVHS